MLTLRVLLGDRTEVLVLAPEREFVHRPLRVGKPFGNYFADSRAVVARDESGPEVQADDEIAIILRALDQPPDELRPLQPVVQVDQLPVADFGLPQGLLGSLEPA